MAKQILTGWVATNGPLRGYPDFRVPDEVLLALAKAMDDGTLPFLLDHDPSKPVVGARLLRAEVKPVLSGEGTLGVWAEYEVDEGVLGERRGFSIAFSVGARRFRNPDHEATIALAADALHINEQELFAVAEELSALATVETARIYRLHALPPEAEIALKVGLDFLYAIGADVFLRAVKRLVHKGQRTRIKIEVDKRPGAKSVTAEIQTDDANVAGEALKLLPDTIKAATADRLEYDAVSGWRKTEPQSVDARAQQPVQPGNAEDSIGERD